ncbi:hypothetical protein THIOM_000231 [Candidatus Thiomargarita nelsonii]|uniref:Uncharacterized protein n=1 Tax=Candidatus Thiomargarita nelsonii TaxID=1003181 RepID=A0A176S720_9GAMM|nr:hypothetical protein THIOM_000231 [Candidatus Thiomargarita nelsonii]
MLVSVTVPTGLIGIVCILVCTAQRVGDTSEVAVRVISVAPTATSVISDRGDATAAVVAKLEIATIIVSNFIQQASHGSISVTDGVTVAVDTGRDLAIGCEF